MCDNDSTINTDCQDIPVEWPVYDRYTDEPICTPLTDLMEAESDAAAMDAEVMSYQDWLEAWDFEPEPAYFEDVIS